jgi:hypothetical protein
MQKERDMAGLIDFTDAQNNQFWDTTDEEKRRNVWENDEAIALAKLADRVISGEHTKGTPLDPHVLAMSSKLLHRFDPSHAGCHMIMASMAMVATGVLVVTICKCINLLKTPT